MAARLTAHDIRHRRGGREVLHVERLEIGPGERVAVLGPNGAGKTTLLRLLGAVDRPSHGAVLVDGRPVTDVDQRRRIAYATQQAGLLTTSVLRNVELPLRWRKVPRGRRRVVALAALERLRITHLADRPAVSLSGGERQRVNLARALALDPAVLLLDEPAAGLDTQSRTAFFADLDDALADRATTVMHVSHRPEEALRFADRVVVLVDGQVHQIGTPEHLNRNPADDSVAALVGYDNLVPARVQPDGAVLVGEASTGLVFDGAAGPATVAVFAAGVRPSTELRGLPVRVERVSPGPGHCVVTLNGAASLLAHLPVDTVVPPVGTSVRVVFDPALSAVLPSGRPTSRGLKASVTATSQDS
ncbi:MAG: ATP-binding cassette domain-containing protein [Propionibacteriales bacterium]|nr:ATP-binding cassette domain-containing protein [Propionibacteriales bacterium]